MARVLVASIIDYRTGRIGNEVAIDDAIAPVRVPTLPGEIFDHFFD